MTGRRWELPLAVLVGVFVRGPFWAEALRMPIDGDGAIIGLMARHPTWSATMWGQPYGSPVEAWIAVPLFALLRPDTATLRLVYFLLGLGLIPAAYALARSLDPRAALPAAVLMACPSPYFLLLAALPPPMYPSALLLAAAVLGLALRLGPPLAGGTAGRAGLVLWGGLAGLALWTHLMTATAVAAAGWWLWRHADGRRAVLWPAAAALLLASAPWWGRALADPQALEVVSVSGRRAGIAAHLGGTLSRLYEPVGGLLGTHVPLVADDAEHVLEASGLAAAAVMIAYGLALVLAARRAWRASTGDEGAARGRLLLAAAGLALLAFPFPLRSSAASVRFLHYPLPYLDEVRFAKDVAWVLTPDVPTDLPAPRAFEEALTRAGGRWRRDEAGRAIVYDGFVPPFGPGVEALASAGAAGDGDPATLVRPSPTDPTTFALAAPRELDAVTLFSSASAERLPRSMDVQVSADGITFETVARRRRRGEREDLRWVNGHPQYVLDHDLIAVPLGGHVVAAVRVVPVLSSDPWTLSEVLLHPALAPCARGSRRTTCTTPTRPMGRPIG
ncbi:MAG: hypothetical protein DMF77_21440 [Acidobacteria bacterium]|nr:MAG: hypothetical protein DMF77_21440 [Acidobacteriota bacterium]